MDRAWFHYIFTTINILSAQLLNIMNIHNYLKQQERFYLV